MEDSGVGTCPQAARSTGRPQYHGGRRGMRNIQNEDRKEGRGGECHMCGKIEKKEEGKKVMVFLFCYVGQIQMRDNVMRKWGLGVLGGWSSCGNGVMPKRGGGKGTIGHGACRMSGEGFLNKRREEDRERRKKRVKQKKGQYTQRNVASDSRTAKLKCTVTMGTLEKKRREKRLTMKYRKKAETICTLNLHVCSSYIEIKAKSN